MDKTNEGPRPDSFIFFSKNSGIKEGLNLDREDTDRLEGIELLESHGITMEELTDSAFRMYEGGSIDEEEAREQFRDLVRKYLGNENVYSLVLAGIMLDEDSRAGQADDPSFLIADELLGINIAEYIGGKEAHFNFIRYDREKPGILSRLEPFKDDVIGGLIAGCMTELFGGDKQC